jgi:hypothetical protein
MLGVIRQWCMWCSTDILYDTHIKIRYLLRSTEKLDRHKNEEEFFDSRFLWLSEFFKKAFAKD